MPIKVVPSPRYVVVDESLVVPFLKGTARTIDVPNSRKLLSEHSAAKRVGCYIFTIRNGERITPWYVGKATKSFSQEVFNESNCRKYTEAFGLKKTGKGEVFFIAAPRAKGSPNRKAISRLENYLIFECAIINSDIRNSRKITIDKFVIAGVINGGAGARSKNAKAVHSMLGRD